MAGDRSTYRRKRDPAPFGDDPRHRTDHRYRDHRFATAARHLCQEARLCWLGQTYSQATAERRQAEVRRDLKIGRTQIANATDHRQHRGSRLGHQTLGDTRIVARSEGGAPKARPWPLPRSYPKLSKGDKCIRLVRYCDNQLRRDFRIPAEWLARSPYAVQNYR